MLLSVTQGYGAQGTDQIRQAFSKRKRGLALKCYQLHKLTDAKVWCPHKVSLLSPPQSITALTIQHPRHVGATHVPDHRPLPWQLMRAACHSFSLLHILCHPAANANALPTASVAGNQTYMLVTDARPDMQPGHLQQHNRACEAVSV